MVLFQKPFPNANDGGVAILQMRKQFEASYKHWGVSTQTFSFLVQRSTMIYKHEIFSSHCHFMFQPAPMEQVVEIITLNLPTLKSRSRG